MKLNFRIKTKEESNFVKSPEELDFSDVDLFGQEGYDASNLIQNKIKIPSSFIVTSAAFDHFLTYNNIVTGVAKLLKEVKPFNRDTAEHAAHEIKKIFDATVFPEEIIIPIQEKYSQLSESTETPLIKLIPSHIIPDEYLSQKDKNFKEITVSGIDEILTNIKEIWMNLFSAQSLEVRANKYYQGPISSGILIQKNIKNELSIKAYNQSSDLGDKRFIDIKCVYGLKYNESFFEENCDMYRISREENMIINTYVNEQKTMYIFDRQMTRGNYVKQANVSSAWVNIKKLDDQKIEEVMRIVKTLEKIYDAELEIEIALEGGELFVENIIEHKIEISEDENITVQAAPAPVVEVKKAWRAQELPQKTTEVKSSDKKMTKSRISELAKEIIEVTKNATSELKNFEPDLNFLKKEERDISHIVEKMPETKIDSTKMIFLNISNFRSEYLNASKNFDGGFLNATELVLNHNKLPEELLETPSELKRLIGDFNTDISLAAKNLSNKPLIYQFSSIGSFERKLLNVVEKKYKYDHDERFLEIPETLAIETIAVRKSRVEDGNKNIWVSIPFLRSKKNLQDIVKIIHLQGLQRSKSFKILLEIVSPMAFFSFDENDFEGFDGVIFNLDKIAKIGNYKSTVRESDYVGIIELIEKFIKKYKMDDYLISLNIPQGEKILKKIDSLKFTGIILNSLPDKNLIDELSDL